MEKESLLKHLMITEFLIGVAAPFKLFDLLHFQIVNF